MKVNLLSCDEVLHEAKDLYSRWPRLNLDEKRAIIENITEQIIVGQGDVTINLCYFPFPGELVAKGPPDRETGPSEDRETGGCGVH